jgi:hypothetical protein
MAAKPAAKVYLKWLRRRSQHITVLILTVSKSIVDKV